MPHRDEFLGKGIFCLIVRKYREAGCIAGARKNNPNIRQKNFKERSRKQTENSLAALIQAEDQALIAGIRAVPKGEPGYKLPLPERYLPGSESDAA